MSVELIMGGTRLTDVTRVTLRLSFRSGLETRDPNALQVVIDRKVGEMLNADADQLAFKLMRGTDTTAGIEVFPASIDMIDDNKKQSIGKWELGEAFVAAMSTADSGQRIGESVTLAANKVVYTKSSGPATESLDVSQ